MPWYVWYLLIGFGWMMFRLVLVLLMARFIPQVRDQITLTASSYAAMLVTWPIDAPWILLILLGAVRGTWSAIRTAKRMKVDEP